MISEFQGFVIWSAIYLLGTRPFRPTNVRAISAGQLKLPEQLIRVVFLVEAIVVDGVVVLCDLAFRAQSHEHFVQNDSQASLVGVAVEAVRFPQDLLRGHVHGRPNDFPLAKTLRVLVNGKPEIGHVGTSLCVKMCRDDGRRIVPTIVAKPAVPPP